MFNIAGNAPSGYDIKNSLRFRGSASAYLNRTLGSASNRTTWTWSGWVKRGALGMDGTFFDAANNDQLRWRSDDTFSFSFNNTLAIQTTQVFRDPSSWYHFVVVADTTQATAANRIKLYVNGVQVTAFSTASYPAQNTTGFINSANAHNIGRVNSGAYYFDGYMAEVNFIDGQALTPSSFGSTDAITGQWLPKLYSGTYGTNGFYLKFADASAATAAAIGKDSSGNANNWTPSGISVTAGTTYDAMIDSPTLTSATVANYCVLNPLDSYSTAISNGNLKFSDGSGNAYQAYSTMSNPDIATYKFYCEVTVEASYLVGIVPETKSAAGANADKTSVLGYYSNGNKYNGTSASAYGATFTTGDIIGIAFGNGQVEFYKNNVSQGVAFSSLTGGYKVATWAAGSAGAGCSFNFGQRPFTYTPPSGFVALNTFNLPTPTIKKGSSYMDATTYTGTGATLSLTNTSAFKPDLVYIKGRSGATDNAWYDSVRGTTKELVSNSTAAETTQATGLTAFNANGFTIGSLAKLNTSAATYVGWQWQAGQGTTTTGTGTGGITSVTQSVNTTAGFSIVTYTGSGANGTVTHGLGVAPKMVLVKIKSGINSWFVYHAGLTSAAYYMNLDSTSAQVSNSAVWNSTAPTSSVFSLGTSTAVNGSASTYVAYSWAEIEGFNKLGTYVGNGSADGTFVYTGFRPKFVMYKARDYAEGWIIYDTSRNPSNLTNLAITPYGANAEFDGNAYARAMDILSNGFKPRGTDTNINGSGYVYIYMAFAENPFKHSNAR